ncbi:hypothetical protein [Xanthomarina sp.]|uniref:hypothetical protein n=1 Tax=Xanthomarina sp. TaxID=1931211 RepID=UPI002C7407AF|nr:hypothetical protein [Xanthomarina sp.]HLV37916.1 hypothetical protein [Xanthomarina sp.]
MKILKNFNLTIIFLAFLSLILASCSTDDSSDNNPQQTESLQEIQGDWIRIGGNYAPNNGMKVYVNSNLGKISDAYNSDFINGDIKWKDIESQGSGHYSYKELGNDYNYYPSSINFGTDDTLRISVNTSGSGNIQKWVREANFTPQSVYLQVLQGNWIRVGGNYLPNNDVVIEVTDNTGTVIDPALSDFGIGDVKWKDIYALDANNFMHEELGNDNSYYTATMEIGKVDSDTLRIQVGSSGAGNIQKWVRH